ETDAAELRLQLEVENNELRHRLQTETTELRLQLEVENAELRQRSQTGNIELPHRRQTENGENRIAKLEVENGELRQRLDATEDSHNGSSASSSDDLNGKTSLQRTTGAKKR